MSDSSWMGTPVLSCRGGSSSVRSTTGLDSMVLATWTTSLKLHSCVFSCRMIGRSCRLETLLATSTADSPGNRCGSILSKLYVYTLLRTSIATPGHEENSVWKVVSSIWNFNNLILNVSSGTQVGRRNMCLWVTPNQTFSLYPSSRFLGILYSLITTSIIKPYQLRKASAFTSLVLGSPNTFHGTNFIANG